jgi:hypothetical protein
MPEVEVEHEEEQPKRFDGTKKFIKKYWLPITVGVVCTTATYFVTRRITLRYLPIEGTSTFIHRAVLKDNAMLYKVFNIYSAGFKHNGPSWMIRCDQTGALFRSQNSAANIMSLSKEQLSKHLNGGLSNVAGYTFTRIGIGA